MVRNIITQIQYLALEYIYYFFSLSLLCRPGDSLTIPVLNATVTINLPANQRTVQVSLCTLKQHEKASNFHRSNGMTLSNAFLTH
jgi:hypothetical protein